jgi:ribosomal protein uS19
MVKKIFYNGVDVDEIAKMTLEQFTLILKSKEKRTMKRKSEKIKKLLQKISKKTGVVKTKVREMVITPSMLGRQFKVYNGKEYVDVTVKPEMIGRRLGEFSIPIKKVVHHGPGVGATRGSRAVETAKT